jgi:CBS domain-containing protein
LIALLHNGGVKIEVISTLVSELNSQIFGRLWSLLAPAELAANSCLMVMGSEGRGEQILKTDQDNALILRDGFEFPELESVAQRFNHALATFGYPPCPGHIMLTNPLWRQPLAGYKTTIADWLLGSHPDGPMHLAIFMDARAVAGDTDLLRQAHNHLRGLFGGSDALLARFAGAVEQFSEPGTWWDRLTTLRGRDEQSFDLKKLGTFPIVHGIRALALEHQLDALRTTERIHLLATKEHLDAALARDLVDALQFLMGLKLKNNLRQRQMGTTPHNLVKLSELGTLERDLLKDSLAIIKRFKQHLHIHFKLEAL